MISISNFYRYYHLANYSNDVSHVSQCLVIPQFVLLRIVVNIPRVTVGRLAGVPLGTKSRVMFLCPSVADVFLPD